MISPRSHGAAGGDARVAPLGLARSKLQASKVHVQKRVAVLLAPWHG